jgi:hypothetical protein
MVMFDSPIRFPITTIKQQPTPFAVSQSPAPLSGNARGALLAATQAREGIALVAVVGIGLLAQKVLRRDLSATRT